MADRASNQQSLTLDILLETQREFKRKVGRILCEFRGSKPTLDLLRRLIPPTNRPFLGFPAMDGIRLTEAEFIPNGFLIPFDQYGQMMTPIYQLEHDFTEGSNG